MKSGFGKKLWQWIVPVLVALAMCAGSVACHESEAGQTVSTNIPFSADALPSNCSDINGVFAVSALLNAPGNACYEWVEAVYGRVVKGYSGSASIWSRNTESQTALLLSAAHVLRRFGEAVGTDIPLTLYNPEEQSGFDFSFLVQTGSAQPKGMASASFMLFQPDIPGAMTLDGYANILPRHDYFALAVDSQTIASPLIPQDVSGIQPQSPDFYDPLQRASQSPTYADVKIGERVLLIGFPNSDVYTDHMVFSVGQVLSDAQIDAALAALREAGDEEGGIAYDPEAEFIVTGTAALGMSGSGVFNEQGILVGVLVRASTATVATPVVRIVRMDFIVSRMLAARELLTKESSVIIDRYLDRGMLPSN